MLTPKGLSDLLQTNLAGFRGQDQSYDLTCEMRAAIRLYVAGLVEKEIRSGNTNFDEYIVRCGRKLNTDEIINAHECLVEVFTPMGNARCNIGYIKTIEGKPNEQ
jgi:hypothetical protein